MISVLPPDWALQKFERDLLVDEVTGLTGVAASWTDDRVVADQASTRDVEILVERLALGAIVIAPDGSASPTRQHRLELAAGGGTRKVTSHALHGLHPYKGKFYPQLARAVLNACAVPSGSVVFDPFAGCGTTVLEADLMGMRGTGVDANPLAVQVANTKIRILRRDADELELALSSLERLPTRGAALPDNYLERWFPEENLSYLLKAIAGIDRIEDEDAKDLALVCLSSVLRKCSFQDPAQIRVYRRKDVDDVPALSETFPKVLSEALGVLRAARGALSDMVMSEVTPAITLKDARIVPEVGNDVDAVVTSPPYANALPYIDTDRLSLRAFSLLGDGGQRGAERRLIGNREITDADARRLEDEATEALDRGDLPERLAETIALARRVAQEPASGFRKRKTPALLFAYFRDMGCVLDGLSRRLKKGSPAILVVGDSTVAGPDDSRLEVETTAIIAELAEARGFAIQHKITKPLTSFGASNTRHQRNAMAEEQILILEAN